jgi:hypothetical protein
VSDRDRPRHVRPRHDRPEITAEVTAVRLLWYAVPGRRLRDRRSRAQHPGKRAGAAATPV